MIIDHLNEARALMIQADAFTSSDMVLQTGEVKADVIAAAQLHATLALVEQQRIANLIALAEGVRTTVNGARSALSGLYSGRAEDGTANMALRADIAAALGIEVAS